jgi:hypothetical protein
MSPEEEPFPGLSTYDLNRDIVEGLRPRVNPTWSYCVCQLMQHCWSDEKEDRPTFVQIMWQLQAVVKSPTEDDEVLGDGKSTDITIPSLRL